MIWRVPGAECAASVSLPGGQRSPRHASLEVPAPRKSTGWQMSEYPGFGILLARLLESRELDAQSLPGTENERGELRAALDGAAPGRPLLQWLAAALGMHVPDLYVIAGMEVPPELAPLDATAGPRTAR